MEGNHTPTTVAELVPWLEVQFAKAAKDRAEGFRKVIELLDERLEAIGGAVAANRADIEKLENVVDFQRGGLA